MRTGAVTADRREAPGAEEFEGAGPTSVRAERRTGTSSCWTRFLILMKFECIPSSREPGRLRKETQARSKEGHRRYRGLGILRERRRHRGGGLALEKPAPMLKTAWIKKGACVIPYGTMSAVELSLTDIMDKMVMDDWGQAKAGPFGALRAHVDAGKLSEKTLHAELGQIVAGLKPGRESDAETNLFWHRGLFALGHRARGRVARKGQAPGHRPGPELPLTMSAVLRVFEGQDLASLLETQALRLGAKTFLRWAPFEGAPRAWSYAEFLAEVRRTAGGLRARGVKAGRPGCCCMRRTVGVPADLVRLRLDRRGLRGDESEVRRRGNWRISRRIRSRPAR